MFATQATRIPVILLFGVTACALSRRQDIDDADMMAAPVVLIPESGDSDGTRLVRLEEPSGVCGATPACKHNSPPEAWPALLEADGELIESLTLDARIRTLRLVLPYDDADCNLACGSLESTHQTRRAHGSTSGSLPSNTPCGTSPGAAHIAIALPYTDPLTPGDYSVEARLIDACGASSKRTKLTFKVLPESSPASE